MAYVKPFCAFRPAADKVERLASHSVERYSKHHIEEILKTNPLSFLQIIYSGELKSIRNKFDRFVHDKVFMKDPSPCFYLYRQVRNNRHHLGIIGLVSVDDYTNGTIRIHEQTLEKKEEKLKEYLDVCEFNAEPVCLTYPHHPELNSLMRAKAHTTPIYDYTADNTRHSVWLFDSPTETEHISTLFQTIPSIFIADGHHRAASSARLAESRKKNNPTHTGNEPYNFFTAAIFADDELTIHSYNRVVHDLNGLDSLSFLDKVDDIFAGAKITHSKIVPPNKGEISIYLRHVCYTFKISKSMIRKKDAVSALDVSILSDYILSPLLNIKDLRNDKRIAFSPGIKPASELQELVDSGKMAAAFCLAPITFSELIAVANSGKEMPPKSTWIEPKLESGLLIYDLSGKC